MGTTITGNKDLIISHILTGSRYEFSIYEKRIFYRIIEANERLIYGFELDQKNRVDTNLLGDKEYSMPISKFFKEGEEKHHLRIKEAFEALMKKVITFRDEKGWEMTPLISHAKCNIGTGIVEFTLPKLIYTALVNFSKGFSKVELLTIINFESVYAMRFYEILSQPRDPEKRLERISYSLEKLKEMFCLKDKYRLTADFVRFVIEPAKKELDAKSPWTFTYEKYPDYGRKIIGWHFYPVYQPQFRDPELERKELQTKVSLFHSKMPEEVRKVLYEQYGFSSISIKNNIRLFDTMYAFKSGNFLKWLKNINLTGIKNPQGYIIKAMRNELKNANIEIPLDVEKSANIANFKNRVIESNGKTMSYDDFVNIKDDE